MNIFCFYTGLTTASTPSIDVAPPNLENRLQGPSSPTPDLPASSFSPPALRILHPIPEGEETSLTPEKHLSAKLCHFLDENSPRSPTENLQSSAENSRPSPISSPVAGSPRVIVWPSIKKESKPIEKIENLSPEISQDNKSIDEPSQSTAGEDTAMDISFSENQALAPTLKTDEPGLVAPVAREAEHEGTPADQSGDVSMLTAASDQQPGPSPGSSRDSEL